MGFVDGKLFPDHCDCCEEDDPGVSAYPLRRMLTGVDQEAQVGGLLQADLPGGIAALRVMPRRLGGSIQCCLEGRPPLFRGGDVATWDGELAGTGRGWC